MQSEEQNDKSSSVTEKSNPRSTPLLKRRSLPSFPPLFTTPPPPNLAPLVGKQCSRVFDHIYLGCRSIAKNIETLRQHGITHVLNCAGFDCPDHFKNELAYKTLYLSDSVSEDITCVLYDAFDYLEDVREQGGRVLVHCYQGVSRSTSVVIGYLMWKNGQSYKEALRYVRAAREMADPHLGFIVQLSECERRVHGLPPCLDSVHRMYRIGPHSPNDPFHLVPKRVCEPSVEKLDSRGAFIVYVPSGLYVWRGKHCSSVMYDNAWECALQIVRYERSVSPVVSLSEGEETLEFFDTLNYYTKCGTRLSEGEKRVEEYDVDFEIFHGAGPDDTCRPDREDGWNRLRRKFMTCDKSNSSALEIEEFGSSTNLSSSQCDYSPSLSPSSSDYSSSFTFSPSSSNLSDLSFVSAQPSLYGLESNDIDPCKSGFEDSCQIDEKEVISDGEETNKVVKEGE